MLGTFQNSAILGEFNPLAPVVSIPLFKLHFAGYTIVVSNTMFMVALACVLLLLIMPLASIRKRLVPGGLQNLIESVCVFVREDIARPILKGHTDQFIGYVWTTFFFILTLNLLAMIPMEKIIFLITGKENHYWGPATANIWVTGSLAILVFIMTHVSGMRQQGVIHYIVHFAPKVPWWIVWIIYPLEIISAFVKPFSLAVRLFANMVYGHILVATLIGLVFVFKNWFVGGGSIAFIVALSVLELFVAFLQAYIFTILTALYIGAAIAPEH